MISLTVIKKQDRKFDDQSPAIDYLTNRCVSESDYVLKNLEKHIRGWQEHLEYGLSANEKIISDTLDRITKNINFDRKYYQELKNG